MNIREKKAVLDSMDHVELYSNIIGKDVKLGRSMRSPFRDDHRPSFGVYRGLDGKIRWKDFARKGGDIYDLIMEVKNTDFNNAVDILYETCGNVSFEKALEKEINIDTKKITVDEIKFSVECLDLMEKMKMNLGMGELYGIRQINGYAVEYFTNGVKTDEKHYSFNDIALAFIRPSRYVKLYFPQREKKDRYKASTADGSFFGDTSTNRHNTILMAGEKDCMTMHHELFVGFVHPVSLSSESAILTWAQYERIKSLTRDNIYILYDNDVTGKENMKLICEQYPDIIPLYEVHEKYPDCNDFNDIVVEKGFDAKFWSTILKI